MVATTINAMTTTVIAGMTTIAPSAAIVIIGVSIVIMAATATTQIDETGPRSALSYSVGGAIGPGVLAMTTNVIRFPKSKRVSLTERLAARRAYRKGMEELAAKAIENAFRESANISGAEDILLKDARLLFVAGMRRALSRSVG